MKVVSVAGYTALRNKIRETLVLGQQKIEEARVRTYWETGKHICEHLLGHEERASYGKEVILRLAKDLGLHDSVLRRCREFAEAFPDLGICATWHKLAWAHYRILMTIPDSRLRIEYAGRANREAWNVLELQKKVSAEIRGEKAPATKGTVPLKLLKGLSPLKPKLGTPGLFRVIRRKPLQNEGDELLIDLGFSVYLNAAEYAADGVRENGVVEFRQAGKNTVEFMKAKGKTENDLFTYRAFVERVVDGDTLRVKIMIGGGLSTRQYLRLRGIDCPELATKDGIKARDFVQSALKDVPSILLTTTSSDKYDRYLADVYFTDSKGSEVYLNNLLLEKGLATPMKG